MFHFRLAAVVSCMIFFNYGFVYSSYREPPHPDTKITKAKSAACSLEKEFLGIVNFISVLV